MLRELSWMRDKHLTHVSRRLFTTDAIINDRIYAARLTHQGRYLQAFSEKCFPPFMLKAFSYAFTKTEN